MTDLFADEPHDPELNYLVVIEGTNRRGEWEKISEPMMCNDALDKAEELHKKYKYIRFTRINN